MLGRAGATLFFNTVRIHIVHVCTEHVLCVIMASVDCYMYMHFSLLPCIYYTIKIILQCACMKEEFPPNRVTVQNAAVHFHSCPFILCSRRSWKYSGLSVLLWSFSLDLSCPWFSVSYCTCPRSILCEDTRGHCFSAFTPRLDSLSWMTNAPT